MHVAPRITSKSSELPAACHIKQEDSSLPAPLSNQARELRPASRSARPQHPCQECLHRHYVGFSQQMGHEQSDAVALDFQ